MRQAMEYISTNYDEEELAWVSPKMTLHQDIFLKITLKEKGKVLIRQFGNNDEQPRIPIKAHKDIDSFEFRISVNSDSSIIQIFTSTEPKEIKYAYI